MKRIALTTALALGLAAPAFAADQLASNAGVQPGVYTTSELAQLIDARERGDWTRVNAIESRATQARAEDRTSAGHVQLARSLDVDPAAYATAQLVELRDARESGDWDRARFIEQAATTSDDVVATASSMNTNRSGGHVQLADSLGVDPNRFSTVELVQLRDAVQGEDWSRVRFILQTAGK